MGTIRMMASGSVQLSYSAEWVRKTKSTHSGKMNRAVLPAMICLVASARSIRSVMAAGSSASASFSICSTAWPELTPGAQPPLIAAAV